MTSENEDSFNNLALETKARQELVDLSCRTDKTPFGFSPTKQEIGFNQPELFIEKTLTLENDEQYWIETHKTPNFPDKKGDVIDAISILYDVAQQKQTERELKQAKLQAEEVSQAKSIYLANISHQWRNALNGILGFTQLISFDDNITPKQRQYIKIINQSVEHLLLLINEINAILDSSKIEWGKLSVNKHPFSFFDFLHNIEEIFTLKARNKNIDFILIKESDLPDYIEADQGKLESIISNLINNAIKFTHQGSVTLTVKVLTREVGEKESVNIEFAIAHRGIPIPENELNKIFEIFTQGSISKKSGEDSGLGLAICQTYTNLLGREIKVGSQLSQGSKVKFNVICQSVQFPHRWQCPIPYNQKSQEMVVLKPEDLMFMGDLWRQKLFCDSLGARYDRIIQSIEQIPPEYQTIRESLKFLADQLNFEELMRLSNTNE